MKNAQSMKATILLSSLLGACAANSSPATEPTPTEPDTNTSTSLQAINAESAQDKYLGIRIKISDQELLTYVGERDDERCNPNGIELKFADQHPTVLYQTCDTQHSKVTFQEGANQNVSLTGLFERRVQSPATHSVMISVGIAFNLLADRSDNPAAVRKLWDEIVLAYERDIAFDQAPQKKSEAVQDNIQGSNKATPSAP